MHQNDLKVKITIDNVSSSDEKPQLLIYCDDEFSMFSPVPYHPALLKKGKILPNDSVVLLYAQTGKQPYHYVAKIVKR